MEIKHEIRAHIVGKGISQGKVLNLLAQKYGWSRSRSNFSDKLTRGTIRYREVIELADVLGYDIIWQKRR